MKHSEANRLVAVLSAAFPRQPIPDETRRLYVEELLPFSFDAGQNAVRTLVRTTQFFPAVAELLDAVGREEKAIASAGRAKALPAPAWTAQDERQAREVMNRALAPYFERHPEARGTGPLLEDQEGRLGRSRSLALRQLAHAAPPDPGGVALVPATDVCSGAGKPPLNVDGRILCPDCGRDVEP